MTKQALSVTSALGFAPTFSVGLPSTRRSGRCLVPRPGRVPKRTRCPVLSSAQSDTASATSLPPAVSSHDRARVLVEALPFMQKFAGKTFVIKYGGAAMKSPELQEMVIGDLVFLSCVGVRPIFVHGGGPEVNAWLSKVGIEPKFLNGLRVTDTDTMDIAEMVLAGRVNKNLVSLINQRGGRAVGLCGKDGGLITAEAKDPALGLVGNVTNVDPHLLDVLSRDGYIPVVSSIGADGKGTSYNINADTVAGELASALKAEKLILLTDVPGVMGDPQDSSTLHTRLNVQQTTELIGDGVISGGMVPKIGCCLQALSAGVGTTHIVDGRVPHSLILEAFTEAGAGTMVVP